MAARKNDKYLNDPSVWLQKAHDTRRAAKLLFAQGDAFVWFPAALLGHHALEMLLKAALIRKGCKIRKSDAWGHDLISLARKLVAEWKGKADFPDYFFEVLRVFNDYFYELRYPQELEKVTELGKKQVEQLEEAIKYLLPYAQPPRLVQAKSA